MRQRRVATAAGARHFKLPIGAPIIARLDRPRNDKQQARITRIANLVQGGKKAEALALLDRDLTLDADDKADIRRRIGAYSPSSQKPRASTAPPAKPSASPAGQKAHAATGGPPKASAPQKPAQPPSAPPPAAPAKAKQPTNPTAKQTALANELSREILAAKDRGELDAVRQKIEDAYRQSKTIHGKHHLILQGPLRWRERQIADEEQERESARARARAKKAVKPTDVQARALHAYIGPGTSLGRFVENEFRGEGGGQYDAINKDLRDGYDLLPMQDKMIRHLTALAEANRNHGGIKVSRGAAPFGIFALDQTEDLTGTVFRDKGFTSATKDPDVASIEFDRLDTPGHVLFEYEIPDGHPALDVNALLGHSVDPREQEVILLPGQAFEIIEDSGWSQREGKTPQRKVTLRLTEAR